MGRRKTYERDDVTERAMRLFWERGYHATSTRDLTEAMGLNPGALYAEFGSKEGLYLEAVRRYEGTVVPGHFATLEAPGASLEQIGAVLNFMGGIGAYDGSHLGCLLCNAGIELAPTLEQSEASTARFLDRLTRAFGHALENARAGRRLAEDAPVDELARFFPTVLMGIFVLARARVDAAVMRAAADQALARLASVTAQGRGGPAPVA